MKPHPTGSGAGVREGVRARTGWQGFDFATDSANCAKAGEVHGAIPLDRSFGPAQGYVDGTRGRFEWWDGTQPAVRSFGSSCPREARSAGWQGG